MYKKQGRSSDLSRIKRLPGIKNQWQRVLEYIISIIRLRLTAAGTVAELHGIPF